MTTLDVRDLSVEVGGKTVVADLSFTLRAGDKMGVVGRNGAGKTSLLEGAGRRGPASQRHRHPDGRDRLPATGSPPAPGRRSHHGSRAHPGRAGSGRPGAAAGEGAHPARGVARGQEHRSVRTSGGGVSRARRLRGGVGGAHAHRRPRLGERPPGAAGPRALGRGAATPGARPDPVRWKRPLDARRADQPPGRRREALADEVPRLVSRRAHRGEPRPEAARRVDHPDPARRPRPGGRVSRHVLPVPEGALRGRDPPARARRPPGAGDPPAQDPGRLDARPDRQARAEGQDAGHARREADGEEGRGSGARATGEVPVPGTAAQRQGDARRERADEELRRSTGLRGHLVRRGARRAAADHGPERRGEDELAPHPRGRDRGRSRDVPIGARGRARLLRAGTRGRARRRAGHRPHEGRVACRGPGAPRAARHVPPLGRDGVPGCGDAVGRREDQARVGAAGRGSEEPAHARRADEQPGPAVADRHRGGAGGTGPAP